MQACVGLVVWQAGRRAGQGLTEYALILLFVAAACFLGLTSLGHAVSTAISSVQSAFSG